MADEIPHFLQGREPKGQKPSLVAHSIKDFLTLSFPPRDYIISPIIPSQGLAMLYAPRGAGKTFVSLSVALAVATGTNTLGDRWVAERKRKVLFVDGEMAGSQMQQRLKALISHDDPPSPDFLKIISPDAQAILIPDLTNDEGQAEIEKHMEGVELLILDNVSTLFPTIKENDAESWVPIQQWLLKLRKKGVAVLLIHHANKGGGQRGSSKKEDILDTVIALKDANDDESRSARFSVYYEKARGFHGDATRPFEAVLMENAGKYQWNVQNVVDALVERIKDLHRTGISQREIAAELKCSPSKVFRILSKLKA